MPCDAVAVYVPVCVLPRTVGPAMETDKGEMEIP